MFIEELTVRGYGRLKNFRIESGPGLNVVFGAHETGKSSVGNCIRDLLLGPGRWDEEGQGPRWPDARPWEGGSFQARVRYRLDGGESYTLQRDFDEGTCRVRDNDAGAEIPMDDTGGIAPGVRPPQPLRWASSVPQATPVASGAELAAAGVSDNGAISAEQRQAEWLQTQEGELRARLEDTQACAARAEEGVREAAYSFRKAQAMLLSTKLDQAREVLRGQAQLRPRLQAVERFGGMQLEQRDQVLRNQGRLEALDVEIGDMRRSLESLQEVRKSVGARLSTFEKFFLVTPADLEAVKSLKVVDTVSPTHLEEKKRNIEGFRHKDADISVRLNDISGRFTDFASDEEFESRIGALEKDVSRSELLASRIADLRESERRLQARQGTGRRFVMWGILAVAAAVLLAFLARRFEPDAGWAAVISGAIAVGCFALKLREDRASVDLNAAAQRTHDEVERMRVSVDQGRDGLRAIFEKCRVTTIKDLRSSYREFRALQRDLATVRAYIWNLERDIEAGQSTQQMETPRVLVDCGVISEWEPVTPRAVSSFLENFRKFQVIQEEEEGLKRRIHELMRDLDERREEEEKLKIRQTALLRDMGVSALEELDWALAGRQEYEKLKAQGSALDERLTSVLPGMTVEEAQATLDDALRSVRAFEERQSVRPTVQPERADEYRGRLEQMQELLATVSGEVAALEEQIATLAQRMRPCEQPSSADSSTRAVAAAMRPGGGDVGSTGGGVRLVAEAGVDVQPTVDSATGVIEQAYVAIMQQEIALRISSEKGRPVLQVRRPGTTAATPDSSGWMSPIALGRSASDLLQGLMHVALWAGPAATNLPLILENPFTRLDEPRLQRALQWLHEATARGQIYFLTSEEKARDVVRNLLKDRDAIVFEAFEGDLEIVAGAAPVA